MGDSRTERFDAEEIEQIIKTEVKILILILILMVLNLSYLLLLYSDVLITSSYQPPDSKNFQFNHETKMEVPLSVKKKSAESD